MPWKPLRHGSTALAAAALITGCIAMPGTATKAPASRAERTLAPTAAVSTDAPAPVPAPAAAATPFLRSDGAGLTLDGTRYQPVGLNAYQLATRWGQNLGCGGMLSDGQLDAFFASLPQRALVRFWAWQGAMATNPSTGRRDWRPLDRVIAAAERHGVVLIVSLGSQSGNCDDGAWKDPAWYEGGYRTLRTGDGYTRATVPYPDYVREIVSR